MRMTTAPKALTRHDHICEILNSASHAVGVALGFVFLALLLLKTPPIPRGMRWAYVLYCGTFALMFYASSMYHAVSQPAAKKIVRIFDHSGIFFFIAGSYGPFVMHVLSGSWRAVFLVLIWAIAIGGFVFKLATVGRYDRYVKVSVALYVAMGWLSLFLIGALVKHAPWQVLLYLFLGGLAYTIGTVFYKKKEDMRNHVIWHGFVLLGAVLQFVAIYKL